MTTTTTTATASYSAQAAAAAAATAAPFDLFPTMLLTVVLVIPNKNHYGRHGAHQHEDGVDDHVYVEDGDMVAGNILLCKTYYSVM